MKTANELKYDWDTIIHDSQDDRKSRYKELLNDILTTGFITITGILTMIFIICQSR